MVTWVNGDQWEARMNFCWRNAHICKCGAMSCLGHCPCNLYGAYQVTWHSVLSVKVSLPSALTFLPLFPFPLTCSSFIEVWGRVGCTQKTIFLGACGLFHLLARDHEEGTHTVPIHSVLPWPCQASCDWVTLCTQCQKGKLLLISMHSTRLPRFEGQDLYSSRHRENRGTNSLYSEINTREGIYSQENQ